MSDELDSNFRGWLDNLAEEWKVEVEQVVEWLGGVEENDEIENRQTYYPELRSSLLSSPLDIHKFAQVTHSCWALMGRYDVIRFNRFIEDDQGAIKAIQELIENFPNNEQEASQRIDNFVAKAVNLGYKRKPQESDDRPGAALLASVILTALYPDRFVDYRQTRWRNFAKAVHYPLIPSQATYGQQLIWAGNFAKALASTATYQLYWSEEDASWIISGICWWIAPKPQKPEISSTRINLHPSPSEGAEAQSLPLVVDIDISESFAEGAKKQCLHWYRERSRVIVQRKKEQALKRDGELRCEICDFCFVEKYGELGQGFIEAHHTRPIATLKPGDHTSVKDIVLLCANCHRMIHTGSHTLTPEELKGKLQNNKR